MIHFVERYEISTSLRQNVFCCGEFFDWGLSRDTIILFYFTKYFPREILLPIVISFKVIRFSVLESKFFHLFPIIMYKNIHLPLVGSALEANSIVF